MNKEICVVHVIIGLGVGGAEKFLFRLIESQMDDSRFQHKVISLTTLGVVGEDLEKIGVKVNCLQAKSIADLFRIFLNLYKIIRNVKPDVVHCWMYHADLLGGIVAKLCGVKKIFWSVRNTDLESGGSLAKKMLRKSCALLSGIVPNKIICVARSAYESHKKIGYNESRMVVINNGYQVSRFYLSESARQKIRAKFHLDDNSILIGSVGRFSPAKDHFCFLEAAAQAYKFNKNLRFLMIGRDVIKENKFLYKAVVEHGLEAAVILDGEVSNVSDYMSAMDVFCMHSETEGFPNVLGEAMCVGLPCISTDVGDASLLMGSLGEIVPAKDAMALSRAILSLASMDASSRRALGMKSRKRIIESFSLDVVVGKFSDIYIS
jgi:glycosyltransferase involved in cell wall biosynthesis